MTHETMTKTERLEATLAFEKADRVLVVPQVVKSTAANYCGVSQAEAEQDMEAALQCELKLYDDIGGWDELYLDIPDSAEMQLLMWQFPLQWKRPGIELPEDGTLQCLEWEAMKFEDYDRIIEEGYRKYFLEDYAYRVMPSFEPGSVPRIIQDLDEFLAQRCVPEWNKRGVSTFTGWAGNHPFFQLSLSRSLLKFTEDVYHHPDVVDRVIKVMAKEMIAGALADHKENKARCTFMVEERAPYYPPAVFERFWWPHVVELVHTMWAEGVVTIFHLDTDWGRYLSYFKRDLPRASYMLQLDSTTDIFAAKELLKGHAMFHGDVPAALQALGTVEEMEQYCKKLIDEVGYEGGFILGTGCDSAPDCSFENLKALVDTGKTYELSKQPHSAAR